MPSNGAPYAADAPAPSSPQRAYLACSVWGARRKKVAVTKERGLLIPPQIRLWRESRRHTAFLNLSTKGTKQCLT